MKNLLIALLLAPLAAFAAGVEVKLDKAPVNQSDLQSLQRGAASFVNYCLNCHSAAFQRWNRLQDLGLTEDQIKKNLIFGDVKIGETMTIAQPAKEAKEWFGAAPPDLTLVARVRGPDWIYTYLRTFYRDDGKPTGWNNVVFPNVGMPHVLWQLQGTQAMQHAEKKEGDKDHGPGKLVLEAKGSMDPAQYDAFVGDLVNFLVYMGEPAQEERKRLGVYVLLFLAGAFVVTYLLKKEFWKDVH